jgi:hypothetical protein
VAQGELKKKCNKTLTFCIFSWHACVMAETWRYRGQEIGGEQLAFLREFA